MKVDILILSSLYDFSTDLITQELEKRGVSYLRLNKECFSKYLIRLDPININLTIKINNIEYCIDRKIKSILYRQPVFLRNTPGYKMPIDEQLQKSQWMAFLRSLLIFNKTKWINNPKDTYLAETKSFQLMLAAQLGFYVPNTLIGNDVSFFREFDKTAIIKSLDTVLLIENDDCLFTYSSLTNIHDLKKEEVSDVPLTIQDYIFPKIDIRVTIIGNKIFSVAITSNGQGIDEDWRTEKREKLDYTDIALPIEIKEKCISLLQCLNLKFGAIDLIKCNEKYYFIEINPTGEWGWLVDNKRRIDLAIADYLMEDE